MIITRVAVASFHSLFCRPFLLLNNGSTRRLPIALFFSEKPALLKVANFDDGISL